MYKRLFLLSITPLVTTLACNCKDPVITHLDFLDHEGQTFNIMDTLQENPFPTKSIYFLLDTKDNKCINYKKIEEYMRNSSMLQEQIKKNYAYLDVFFLKTSDCTEGILRFKTHKELYLCNKDMVVEYVWSDGVASDTAYYDDGIYRSNIKLEDVK